jgi:alpha-N-acetylglucosaminidase
LPAQSSAGPAEAIDSLIERILPGQSSSFSLAVIPADAGRDVFELDYSGGKVVIRGNNANSMAQGLNYYLKYSCNVHLSLTGSQLTMPATLPAVSPALHIVSPYKYRYMLNYCTYNYSMSFWTWDKWEWYLDWMALSGINLALAGVFGEEGVWQNTLRQIGYADADIGAFIPGPAWNAWWLMGNLEGWGGPLSQSEIDARVALGQKIVTRMRQLGIQPVLQGFYGMVPNSLIAKYPTHKIYSTGTWCGFTRPAMMDPTDTLFTTMANIWYAVQKQIFGDAQFFGGDPFHEGGSANINLTTAATRIHQAMIRANPAAVWVLQGWQGNPQDALLAGTVKAQTLILDLKCEQQPQWTSRNGWNGYPWVWNALCHFGGKEGLYGPLSTLATGPVTALTSSIKNAYCGIGAMPEGVGTNVVTWDLLFDMGWRTTAWDLTAWLTGYSQRRYGKTSTNLQTAWQILSQGVYQQNTSGDIPESILCARPSATITSVSSWGTVNRSYNNNDLINAWQLFLADTAKFAGVPTYEHDLVDFTRQLLANYAMPLQNDMMAAYNSGDQTTFSQKSKVFLNLILDQDTLLSTDQAFLLGRWIQDARNMGATTSEKKWYEWCARTLITTWGPRAASEDGGLHEYSHREWSGILGTLYYNRWKLYTDDLAVRLSGGKGQSFDWFTIDSAWCRQTTAFDTLPRGNAIATVRRIAGKYNNFVPDPAIYGIAVGKPVTATSYETGFPPSAITDSSTSGSYWGASPAPQSVTIDLLALARIDSIRVFPYYDGTRYYQYTVAISTDNSNWTTVGNFSTNTQPATAQGTLSVVNPSRNARYIKVTMTFNSTNPAVHLYEVRVFGAFIVPATDRPSAFGRPCDRIFASGKSIIIRAGDKQTHTISVYSINGRAIHSFSVCGSASYKVRMDAGVYLISVKKGNETEYKRIIVR